jgi:hypothetical protein
MLTVSPLAVNELFNPLANTPVWPFAAVPVDVVLIWALSAKIWPPRARKPMPLATARLVATPVAVTLASAPDDVIAIGFAVVVLIGVVVTLHVFVAKTWPVPTVVQGVAWPRASS